MISKLGASISWKQFVGQPVLEMYEDFTPCTLFRVMNKNTKNVVLREKDAQLRKNIRSFDYIELYNQIHPPSGVYVQPNGMGVSPFGSKLTNKLTGYSGEASVFEIPQGCSIPEDLLLVHEFEDSFSFQPRNRCNPKEFCKILSAYLGQFNRYSKKDWFQKYHIKSNFTS